MRFEELQDRFGTAIAERVRELLTLQEFAELEMEEIPALFEERAEQAFRSWAEGLNRKPSHSGPAARKETLDILRRRWREAEELAYAILAARSAAPRPSPSHATHRAGT